MKTLPEIYAALRAVETLSEQADELVQDMISMCEDAIAEEKAAMIRQNDAAAALEAGYIRRMGAQQLGVGRYA